MFISICIPTYNRANYITETIQSIIPQIQDDMEIIIADDGSTDNTHNIIEAFNNPQIKYFIKDHTNSPDTRNLCINKSSGKYILWIDSDDVLLPSAINAYINVIETYPNADILYGNLYITDSELNIQKELIYEEWYKRNNELISSLLWGNYIPNPASLIKKSLYDRVGLYDVTFNRAHDYEFWTRAVKNAVFKHLDMFVLKWRWHNSNMSAETVKIDTSYEARIVHNMLNIYPLEMIFANIIKDNMNKTVFTVSAYMLLIKRLIILKDYNGALLYVNKCSDLYNFEELEKLKMSILEIISGDVRK